MKDYTAHNLKVFKKGLKAYVREISDELMDKLAAVAERMVEMIDDSFAPIDWGGNEDFPVWTANLHDATGVGVYRDGALTGYVPTKHARWKQSDGITDTRNIDGFEELQNAIQDGALEYGHGVWIVLFSAVPYAYRINEEGSPLGSGAGFFDKTAEGMLNEVLKGLAPLKVAAI